MADLKISALTDGGGLQAGDLIPVDRSGSNNKVKGIGVDGWLDDSADTWTYVSATSFKISGVDRRAVFTPGTRIKLTQTTVKYFVVASSSFSTDTTVTITGGTDYTLANAAISANFHSYSANPQGYPGWFAYSPANTGWSSTTKNDGRFCVNGRMVTIKVIVQGTSNSTAATVNLPITAVTNQPNDVAGRVEDNGVFQTGGGLCELDASGGPATTVGCHPTMAGGTFTASGQKEVSFQMSYEI